MKVEKIVNIYNESGRKINVGDVVTLTYKGKDYKGTVKRIGLNNMALWFEDGTALAFVYNQIDKLI